MRPGRAGPGELQHPRSQRCEDDRHRDGGCGGREGNRRHGVEVGGHRRDRPPVGLAARGDEALVTDTHAEHETTGIRVAQRERGGAHRRRVACVDAGDAGGDHELRGRAEQDAGMRERLLPTLAEPERAVAERLDLPRGVPLGLGCDRAECPEPDPCASDSAADGADVGLGESVRAHGSTRYALCGRRPRTGRLPRRKRRRPPARAVVFVCARKLEVRVRRRPSGHP